MENEVYPSLEEKASPADVKVSVEDGGDGPSPPGHGDEVNETAVKFLPSDSGAGQDSVEITRPNGPASSAAFSGMSKQELMKFADDPFWVRLRWALLILCFLLWIAILAGAIAIVVVAPKCPDRDDPDWWRQNIIYRAVPQAFKDSDGDGVGDFKGISSKTPYLSSLGVKALWLTPIHPSGGQYVSYDITDYKNVDPQIGTMAQFTDMVKTLHGKGLKVILDFIPNHTSVKHPWFLASSNTSHPDHGKYKDYYVWSKEKPNSWETVHGDDAWSQNPSRNEWYYHVKTRETADLNMWNSNVRSELKNVLTYWMDAGVDGFYINDVLRLYESKNLSVPEDLLAAVYEKTNHTQTVALPESFKLLEEWKGHVRSYKQDSNSFRVVITGGELAYADQLVSAGSDLVMSVELAEITDQCLNDDGGACVEEHVMKRVKGVKEENMAKINWKMSGVEYPRLASRVRSKELSSPLFTLLMLLPGTSTTYYGEEIGMADAITDDIKADRAQDKYAATYPASSRDFHRTPMQWSNETNAGFSEADPSKTWLPVPNVYKDTNVMVEEASGPGSLLSNYRSALELRQSSDTFKLGGFKLGPVSGGLFSFMRVHGDTKYLVAMNMNDEPVTLPASLKSFNVTETGGEVVFNTHHGRMGTSLVHVKMNLSDISLPKAQAIVVKLG